LARDRWDMGSAYEPYVGRWSRVVARRFVEWLGPDPGGRWLDIGCGTGALTEAIVGLAEPSSVRGIDPSEGYVASAREHVPDPRASFAVGDAQGIPAEDDAFDHTVSGLVLNFVPDPEAAAVEMRRVTREGGSIAAYVWDYAEGMQMMRIFWEAAAELDAEAAALDEGARFPLCRPEPLRTLWQGAGLRDAEVQPIDIDTTFRDLDDFWTPFLGGQGPAPSYATSLTEDARAALRDRIAERLPTAGDGTIPLRARAWAVRGTA